MKIWLVGVNSVWSVGVVAVCGHWMLRGFSKKKTLKQSDAYGSYGDIFALENSN